MCSDSSSEVGSGDSHPNRRGRAAAAAAALRRRLGITRGGFDSPPDLESGSSGGSSRSSSRARSDAEDGPGATGLLTSSSGTHEAGRADEQPPQLASGSGQGQGQGGTQGNGSSGGSRRDGSRRDGSIVPPWTSTAGARSRSRRGGTPSPMLAGASSSSDGTETPPLLADDGSSSSDDEAPPMLSAEDGSSSSGDDPPAMASTDGSSADGRHRNEDVPSLVSDASFNSDSDFSFPGSHAAGESPALVMPQGCRLPAGQRACLAVMGWCG